MKVIFLGNSEISVNALKALTISNDIDVVGVVTNNDKKVGRNHNKLISSPVAQFAENNNLFLIKTDSINKDISLIKDIECDYIITCSFGSYLSSSVLGLPKIQPLNIHTSLLPKGRGGAPIHWSIIRGEKETGYSVMEMVDEMDAGDYYIQTKIDILKEDTYDSMYEKLSKLIEKNLANQLLSIHNNQFDRIPQKKEDVTFSLNIKKENQIVNFNDTSINIFNKIRGLNSKPGSIAIVNDIELKIWDSKILENIDIDGKYEIGQIVKINKEGIMLKTKDYFIWINEITIPGKKKQKVEQMLNGKLPFKEGDVFK